LYCSVINVRNPLRGRPYSIYPTDHHHIYRVTDGEEQLYICRRGRHKRSRRGVKNGILELASVYHLDSIDTSAGGLLIDCGANVGELGVWARWQGLDYIAFEPEELESRCCDLNNYAGQKRTHRKALWNENTKLQLFRKPDSADSSVIEMDKFVDVREVQAVRLDADIDLGAREGVILLKVEAEGAEPEVLEGARGILDQIDYVAVDCGRERGVEKIHTFVETCNLLTDNGFCVARADFKRITILYRNARKARPC